MLAQPEVHSLQKPSKCIWYVTFHSNDGLMRKWLYAFCIQKGEYTPVKQICLPVALEWQLCEDAGNECIDFKFYTPNSFWTILS